MTNSSVDCVNRYACSGSIFHGSNVTCKDNDYSCINTQFFTSAVKCQDATYQRACPGWDVFYQCSCCDGPDCTYGEKCKNLNSYDEFCSSTYFGRTCKDWGNPVCTETEIPSNPPLHEATACRPFNEEIAICSSTEQDCSGLVVDGCSVLCHDSCQSTTMMNSSVHCVNNGACSGSKFHGSNVTCENRDYSCANIQLFNSAVECQDATYQRACPDWDVFYQCSCCDGPDCTYGVNCKNLDSYDEFCSSTYFGRTCKDWGNPICADVEVPSNPPVHDAASCLPFNQEIAICSSTEQDCTGLVVDGCSVLCHDSCQSATMTNSSVHCVNNGACSGSKFHGSNVTCENRDYTCTNTQFFASAVECQDATYQRACPGQDVFYQCSCCDGPDCTFGEKCKNLDSYDDFCSSTYFGRTCKDWGNPVCADVEVPSNPPVHDAASCLPFNQEIVICDKAKQDCTGLVVDDCSVLCHDSCQSTVMMNSSVHCVNNGACSSSKFYSSNVTCENRDYTCANTQFFASAVQCQDANYERACPGWDVFYQCSCCDGPDCTYGVNCKNLDSYDEFCSSTYFGRTCKGWGNPVCADVEVPSNPPVHDAASCLPFNEEMVICDTAKQDCTGLVVEDCSVLCHDSCQSTIMTNSSVHCVNNGACSGSKFHGSSVTCEERDYACNNAQFVASAVECLGAKTCPSGAAFDGCSCCDGPYCPEGISSCSGSELWMEAFCLSEDNGPSCALMGNPACRIYIEPGTNLPTATDSPTASPTTESPATNSPTTEAPTTASPTTASPTTTVPRTTSPATPAPTTASPATESPTTALIVVNVTALSNLSTSIDLFENNTGTVATVEEPMNGNITIQPGGSLSYTPDPGFIGKDQATVLVCNDSNGICHTVTVQFLVEIPQVSSDAAEEGGSRNEALYALLGLIFAPLLWFLQEPLNRCYQRCVFKDKGDGQPATTVASTTGATSIPNTITVNKHTSAVRSITSRGSVGPSVSSSPPAVQSGSRNSLSVGNSSDGFSDDDTSTHNSGFSDDDTSTHDSSGEHWNGSGHGSQGSHHSSESWES